MSGEGLTRRSARGPLECLSGNARQAAEYKGTKQGSAGNTCSQPRMQRKAHAPAVKRIARPRGAGHVDFGVQIFAKPPPPLQDSCQVCPILHTDHDDLTCLPSGWAWPISITLKLNIPLAELLNAHGCGCIHATLGCLPSSHV